MWLSASPWMFRATRSRANWRPCGSGTPPHGGGEPVHGRFGVVGSLAGVQGRGERDRTAGADLADGCQGPFGGEGDQGSPGRPAAGRLVAQFAIERPECGLAHLVGRTHAPTIVHTGGSRAPNGEPAEPELPSPGGAGLMDERPASGPRAPVRLPLTCGDPLGHAAGSFPSPPDTAVLMPVGTGARACRWAGP